MNERNPKSSILPVNASKKQLIFLVIF